MIADADDARVESLLLRWEELRDEGRTTSAEELCRDCPELAGELERRIAALRALGPVLTAGSSADPLISTDPDPGRGRTSAPARARATCQAVYSDLRFHAEGGLGEVFMARGGDLNRDVALKFIKPARAGDPESRRRFLLEAEVTGRLEHPGVVPVYGLGLDGGGSPCYAMRFVRGETLHDAIAAFHAADHPGRDPSERALALRGLLRRFVSVSNTVAYAHSRGVLHRDIKPRNVMLGKYDETLLVDWGLAKPFDRGDARDGAGEETLTPSSGDDGSGPPTVGVVGTPAYMSPEQADGQWDLVGPASDVYSLGATLYCLLTGAPPFQGHHVAGVVEKVRRGEFPPPRRVKPGVDRALEAVCLKAMAWYPDDRYASALDLAADVERWLADEPVSAYREPRAVRARRWLARHRTLAASALVAAVVAVVGLAVVAAVKTDANRRLGLAYKAERDARTALQATLARERAALRKADVINDFLLNNVIAQAAPDKNDRARKVTVEEVVDRAAATIGTAFGEQPEIEAQVRETIGETYRKLGEPAKAEPHLLAAYDLLRKTNGEDDPDTLAALVNVAVLREMQGQWGEAEDLLRRVYGAQRRVLGAEHRHTLTTANNLAMLLQHRGKHEDAEALGRQTLEAADRALGPDDHTALVIASNLATILQERGRWDEAERYDRRAVDAFRKGDRHPDLLAAVVNLGDLLRNRGRYDEAEPVLREAVEASRRVAGDDHPDTLSATTRLAHLLADRGRRREAEALYRTVLEGRRSRLGAEHPETLTAGHNLAVMLGDRGQNAEAEALLRANLETERRTLGGRHDRTLHTVDALATVLQHAGRLDEAEPLFRECYDAYRARGDDHPDTLRARNNLANFLVTRDKLDEAEPLLRQNLDAYRRVVGDDHLGTLAAVHNLAALLRARGKLDEAEPLYRKGLEACRKVIGPENPNTLTVADGLAGTLRGLGRVDEAETVVRDALAVARRALGDPHPVTVALRTSLGDVLRAAGRPSEAEVPLREALEVRRASLPAGHPATLANLVLLGWSLFDQGNAAEAEPLLREGLDGRRKILPQGHRLIATAESILGGCLTKLGRYDEAEALLLDSLPVLEKLPPGLDQGQAARTGAWIVALYEAWGKPDQAKAWKVKLGPTDLPSDVFAPAGRR
jgi:serine/threonine protein kinase